MSPGPWPNVFEPIVKAGELESVADYQLHYLAQADFLADNEEMQCVQPRAPPTKEARAERNLQKFYRKCGHPLGQSVKSFEDRLEKQELRDRSAVSPVPPDLVRHFMRGHEDMQVTVRKRPPEHYEGHAAEASVDVYVKK